MADSQLIDRVIRGMEGPRVYTFRYERRTVDGVFIEDISRAFLPGGEIRLDNEAVTLRTARFVVDVDALPGDWNYGEDFVQVFCDFQVPGSSVVAFPLGLFQMTQPDKILSLRTHRAITVQGSDLNDRFARDKMDVQTVATSATEGVVTLLGEVGLREAIGLEDQGGGIWPPINKTRRDTAYEIAFSGAYYAPWPDEYGVFRMTPKLLDGMFYEWVTGLFPYNFEQPVVDLARAGTHVTYSMSGDGQMVLTDPEPRITVNLNQGANSAIVAEVLPPEPGTAGTIVVTVENNDPNSPINKLSTGIRLLNHPLASLVPGPSGGELVIYRWVPYELADADSRSSIMKFASPIDPRRTAHEYYQITGSDQLPSDATGWKARSWQLPLTVGAPMLHEVSICRPIRVSFAVIA